MLKEIKIKFNQFFKHFNCFKRLQTVYRSNVLHVNTILKVDGIEKIDQGWKKRNETI